jgi:hypothetical protein
LKNFSGMQRGSRQVTWGSMLDAPLFAMEVGQGGCTDHGSGKGGAKSLELGEGWDGIVARGGNPEMRQLGRLEMRYRSPTCFAQGGLRR